MEFLTWWRSEPKHLVVFDNAVRGIRLLSDFGLTGQS